MSEWCSKKFSEFRLQTWCYLEDQSGLPNMVPVVWQSPALVAMSPHLEDAHGYKRLKVCLLSRRHDEQIDD